MKTRTKAQMEILGLAVVMLLLVLGLFLFVKFAFTGESQEDLREEYINAQLSSLTINTLLKTDANCKGATVSQLLIDCADYYNTGSIDCNSDTVKDSCTRANAIIKSTLEQTLTEWNRKYTLTIEYPNPLTTREFTNEAQGGCTFPKKLEPYPLPTSSGKIVKIMLAIC